MFYLLVNIILKDNHHFCNGFEVPNCLVGNTSVPDKAIFSLRRTCAARVTVLGPSVSLLPRLLPPRARDWPKNDSNAFSATLASLKKFHCAMKTKGFHFSAFIVLHVLSFAQGYKTLEGMWQYNKG